MVSGSMPLGVFKQALHRYCNCGLVLLLGKYDQVIRAHLRSTSSKEYNDPYCGKANEVLENIQNKLHKGKYWSAIVDCMPEAKSLRDVIDREICVKEHLPRHQDSQ